MTIDDVIRDAKDEGWDVDQTADALAFKGCGRTISYQTQGRYVTVRNADSSGIYFGGPESADVLHERLRQTKMLHEISSQREGVAK